VQCLFIYRFLSAVSVDFVNRFFLCIRSSTKITLIATLFVDSSLTIDDPLMLISRRQREGSAGFVTEQR
jgi:hypothetical protein